jgi:hypothetical protein
MKRISVALVALLAAGSASAQFEVDRFRIAGGGGQSQGGAWSLSGTVGQYEADVIPLCSPDGTVPGQCGGATLEIVGGFWAGLQPAQPHPSCGGVPGCLFRDGFEVLP